MSIYEKHVFVCENERPSGDPRGCCHSKGAGEFTSRLKKLCKEAGITKTVRINKAGCLDQCAFGPVAVVYPEGVWYKGLKAEDADRIFKEHILGGKPVADLRYK